MFVDCSYHKFQTKSYVKVVFMLWYQTEENSLKIKLFVIEIEPTKSVRIWRHIKTTVRKIKCKKENKCSVCIHTWPSGRIVSSLYYFQIKLLLEQEIDVSKLLHSASSEQYCIGPVTKSNFKNELWKENHRFKQKTYWRYRHIIYGRVARLRLIGHSFRCCDPMLATFFVL